MQGSLFTLSQEINKLSENISALSQSANLRVGSETQETSNATNYPQPRKRPRIETDNYERSPRPDSPGTCSYRNLLAEEYLLNRDNLETLLDTYFTNVHPWIPMIHAATFKRQVRAGHSLKSTSTILQAILSATLHLMDLEKMAIPAHQIHHVIEQSRNQVVLDATNTLSVENLQALIIIAFTDVSTLPTVLGIECSARLFFSLTFTDLQRHPSKSMVHYWVTYKNRRVSLSEC